MERTLIVDAPKSVGHTVQIIGWVKEIKNHGNLIFLNIEDISGCVQALVIPDNLKAYNEAKKITLKNVVGLVGVIKEAPTCLRDSDDLLKCIEIEVSDIKILNQIVNN